MITDHGLITEREERTLRSWLDESPPMLPDRVWSAVMAEVPATRQRRPTVVTHALPDRRWARLLLAAALVTALAGGLIAGVGATGLVRLPGPPHALPRTGELDPGTYVVDAPFATRVSFAVPAGWAASESADALVVVGRDATVGPQVMMTVVDGVYRDACDPNKGLRPNVGPGASDLATAIAALASVDATPVGGSVIDRRPANGVSVVAPAGPAACTTHPDDAPYQLWGLPNGFGLWPGERADLSIVMVDDVRLVVVVVVPPGSAAADVDTAHTVVASMRLGADAPIVPPAATPVPDASSPEPPPSFEPIQPGAVLGGNAELAIPLYATGASATAVPLTERFVFSLSAPDGWLGTTHGLAAPDGSASIEAWSIRTLHPDPCHWRSSSVDVTPQELDGLATALATAWSFRLGSPGRSVVTDPPWNGNRARLVDLSVPLGVDPAVCDGGVLRGWEDRDGTPRLLQRGERIRFRLTDFRPGLVIVAFATSADASASTEEAARLAGFSLWVGPVP